MTQEEKAKAYDEALEKARQYLGAAYPIAYANLVKEIFPELAESKDEKIRKNCIHFLEFQKQHHAATFEIEECIAWLEKQGEKKSVKKQTYWTEEEIEPIISDYLCGREHYGGMIGRLRCLKPKQKPVEWSEDDKSMALTLMRDVDQISFISKEGKNERIGWLNNLEERFIPQPKQEWSEEDDVIFEDLYNYLTHRIMIVSQKDCDSWAKWIKSLKQRMSYENV